MVPSPPKPTRITCGGVTEPMMRETYGLPSDRGPSPVSSGYTRTPSVGRARTRSAAQLMAIASSDPRPIITPDATPAKPHTSGSSSGGASSVTGQSAGTRNEKPSRCTVCQSAGTGGGGSLTARHTDDTPTVSTIAATSSSPNPVKRTSDRVSPISS